MITCLAGAFGRKRQRLCRLLVLVTLAADARAAATLPQVELIGRMSTGRAAHQATLLTTGDVLITGGCGGERCDSVHASADLYDPVSDSIRPIGRMTTPRSSHVAVTLADGRVLVAGGWSGEAGLASAEMYDPSTGLFAAVANMTAVRISPAATLLSDGRVLITGGEAAVNAPLSSAEVFDPETSMFSATGSMNARRMSHVAATLADGSVLIAGGHSARGDLLRSAEIFDPSTGAFRLTGSMAAARHKHAAVGMPDGRVLVIGGSNAGDFRGRYDTTEFYVPAAGRFSPGPQMNLARHKIRDAVLMLPSGEVVVAGGAVRPELLRRTGRSFVAVPGELSGPQMFSTATLVGNRNVLILGGYNEQIQSSAEAWLMRFPKEE